MTLLRRIHLIGQTFAVEFVDPGVPELEAKADMPNVGTMRVFEQRILVADNLGPDQTRDTVLHEVLHALLRLVSLIPKNDEEERIVVALTPLLLDALRRNPDLVAYLTAAVSGADQ